MLIIIIKKNPAKLILNVKSCFTSINCVVCCLSYNGHFLPQTEALSPFFVYDFKGCNRYFLYKFTLLRGTLNIVHSEIQVPKANKDLERIKYFFVAKSMKHEIFQNCVRALKTCFKHMWLSIDSSLGFY